MKKIVQVLLLSLTLSLRSAENNLMIFLDADREESVKSSDVSVTHQAMVALQQRAGLVMISDGVWKNIEDRKHAFTKKLEDTSSPESLFLQLYGKVCQQLKNDHYNPDLVNKALDARWFAQNYSKLDVLDSVEKDQIKFNFFCYIFSLDISRWKVYRSDGIILFVPGDTNFFIDISMQVFDIDALNKHSRGKLDLLAAVEHFGFTLHDDRWIIYLSGHGHAAINKQKSCIAGLSSEQFQELLQFLDKKIKTQLFVYSSCYAGGINATVPYDNLTLSFPIIVIGLTDAPIYAFGLFEGVKLPPYTDHHYLTEQDLVPGFGLQVDRTQDYTAFFDQAWSGAYDCKLVSFLSQFYTQQQGVSVLQKVENIPLFRAAGSMQFLPFHDQTSKNLFEEVVLPDQTIFAKSPILLSAKDVSKIVFNDKSFPLVAMLPGNQSYTIKEIFAPSVSLSTLLSDLFFSMSDAVLSANIIIDQLVCYNDLQDLANLQTLSHCALLVQQDTKPSFIHEQVQALFYFQQAGNSFLLVYKQNKLDRMMQLDYKQEAAMQDALNNMIV